MGSNLFEYILLKNPIFFVLQGVTQWRFVLNDKWNNNHYNFIFLLITIPHNGINFCASQENGRIYCIIFVEQWSCAGNLDKKEEHNISMKTISILYLKNEFIIIKLHVGKF